MKDIVKFLSDDSIIINCDSKSQKNALEVISKKMSMLTSANEDEIFAKLYDREKLATTAFGNGIAITHARVEGIQDAKIIILKLDKAISFNSTDNSKVDIIISLLVPNDKNDIHVELLSYIASLLDDKIFREKIRAATTVNDIMTIIKNSK